METKVVKLNDSVFIALPGKGTSGLVWQYKIDIEGIIEVEKIDYEGDVHAIDKNIPVGSSIPEVFKVVGKKKGLAKIHFEQRRPWEQSSNPVDTVEYEITVED
ncbi:protease inhibitor I42 family protein [Solitalea sp. MAHUQ-68]|uniref:Protease inhibitor I42 family protein n=1 Tax=Solitalea agri TaxID=2953739 RepID=A0A9X2F302_9SPHI|nr:protease inhibitor I42 family protein [Solitalea agri]MCO4291436.1 protease inhibitor I42 family protein [Solitalea agri]